MSEFDKLVELLEELAINRSKEGKTMIEEYVIPKNTYDKILEDARAYMMYAGPNQGMTRLIINTSLGSVNIYPQYEFPPSHCEVQDELAEEYRKGSL